MIGSVLDFRPIAQAIASYRMRYVPRYTAMVADTLTLGGVYFECIKAGTATGAVTIAYANTGTAGSETVAVVGNAITVGIQTAVSTPAQVATAVNNSSEARLIVFAQAQGTAAVTTTGSTPLAGQIDLLASVPDGFEEYIVIDAGIKMLAKEESETAPLVAEKAAMRARVMDMAGDRDAAEPEVISTSSEYSEGW